MASTVALTLRVPEELHPRMRVCAAHAGTSLNAWIVAALNESVEIEEEEREQTRQTPRASAATA